MPRSGVNGTFSLPGAQATQQPNTTIPSAVNNQGWLDVEQTFNTPQPVAYGGTGATNAASALTNLNAVGYSTQSLTDAQQLIARTNISSALRGQIYGLTLSNGTDAVNDIDVNPGEAASDDASPFLMVLPSLLTKQLDAAWAVGNNQGMRATGAAIANTTYHIFLIMRPDTGVVDVAADTSITGANISANTNVAYTKKRRIFSIVRKAGTIKAFSQIGDDVIWLTAEGDVAVTNLSTSATNYTLTVPIGLPVNAKIRVFMGNAAISVIKVSSPFESNTFDSLIGNASFQNPVAGINIGLEMSARTSISGEIRAVSSSANTTLRIATFGYTDTRGR